MEPIGSPPRLTVFCHIQNEAFLLPFWIRHHRRLFDHGVIVDRGSTDESLAIIRELAPTWDIIPSRNLTFDAVDCDREMMDVEARYDGWKLVLNVTEFVFHPDLANYLQTLENTRSDTIALSIPMVTMVDPPQLSTAPVDPDVDLWRQRYHGRLPADDGSVFSRFLHKNRDGRYGIGRHSTTLPALPTEDILILRYSWSPFAAIRERKLSVQSASAATDITRGLGFHHLCTPEQLDAQYAVQSRVTYDLREREPYRSIYLAMASTLEHPIREQVSTRASAPAEPLSPTPIAVLGTTDRCGEWVDALDAIPAETLAAAPPDTAVLLSSREMCNPMLFAGRTGLIIVDLCEPPDPHTIDAPPLISPYRQPTGVIGVSEPLAAADYIVFSSEEMRAVWMPLLIQAGRVTESAGPEVMTTISRPRESSTVEPVRKFLSDPVRRGVPTYSDRTITVSEASYRLAFNVMLRGQDDYNKLFTAFKKQAAGVAALQQQNAALKQQVAALSRALETPIAEDLPAVRTTGTRRLRFPLARRNQV